MPRALPLALVQHRPRPRPVPAPVSLAEMDTCRALERQGVDRDLIIRVVLPMARALRPPREGAALIRYLLDKSNGGGPP